MKLIQEQAVDIEQKYIDYVIDKELKNDDNGGFQQVYNVIKKLPYLSHSRLYEILITKFDTCDVNFMMYHLYKYKHSI